MTKHAEIMDTFPAFLEFWDKVRQEPVDVQLAAWADDYLSKWPELLAKQIDNYSSQKLDWRKIAREKIFPHINERLPSMHAAHDNLNAISLPLYEKIETKLGFDQHVIFVIYVGIGYGAGAFTTFSGNPAILFGLENIADCGWNDPQSIQGLLVHETGHLIHNLWRRQNGKADGDEHNPWWQLYSEGFALYCEELITGTPLPVYKGGNADWQSWWPRHKAQIAGKFLRMTAAGESISAFFGHWYEIEGKRQTGYFLGHEVLRELGMQFNLKEIAVMDDIESRLKPILKRMADS